LPEAADVKLAKVIVLDEFLDRVSALYAEGIMEFLRGVNEQLGVGIVFVSHRPEYREYVHKVISVRAGSVEKA
jgi:ABC-type lipoprotein export system ATPase subunit